MVTPIWPNILQAILTAGTTVVFLLAVMVGIALLVDTTARYRRRKRVTLATLPAHQRWSRWWDTSARSTEPAGLVCSLCRFPTELDDVAVARGGAACICLRCFARETGAERHMPTSLRRAVIATLAEIPRS